MEELLLKSFEDILKDKQQYYGETKASFDFAAETYSIVKVLREYDWLKQEIQNCETKEEIIAIIDKAMTLYVAQIKTYPKP